jgi:exopolysaccharide production protein ExoQ
MLNILLSLAILAWFVLLYGAAQQGLATVARPQDGPLVVPIALQATVAFMPLVFVVERKDGRAILEEGLTASNIMLVALAGLTGLYLAAYVLRRPRLLSVPFSRPYLPFTLMIGMDGLSVFWSVVPAYTAYRAVELSIFYLAAILIFDRSDIESRLADLLALFVVIWLATITPTVVTNLMSGIVFSSGKNNMMPFVCAALAFLVAFDRRQPRRRPYLLLALAGFIVAGSAASTGALIAVVPGVMIASARRSVRVLGIVATLVTVATFLGLMLTISMFPELLEAASTILQKPAEELANGTGRNNFWPIFLEATRDRLIGSGFSAGDRFLDVIIAKSAPTSVVATQTVGLASAHNMFLSAWASLGLIGLCFTGVVLVTAVRWGLKLEEPGRRFVISSILMLILNGMTTPGIFQDWNINTLTFVAILAYARIGVLRRTVQSFESRAPGPVGRPDWHMA